jgi:hypothetical protein
MVAVGVVKISYPNLRIMVRVRLFSIPETPFPVYRILRRFTITGGDLRMAQFPVRVRNRPCTCF